MRTFNGGVKAERSEHLVDTDGQCLLLLRTNNTIRLDLASRIRSDCGHGVYGKRLRVVAEEIRKYRALPSDEGHEGSQSMVSANAAGLFDV